MSPVFETQCSTENVISIILADFIRRCHIFFDYSDVRCRPMTVQMITSMRTLTAFPNQRKPVAAETKKFKINGKLCYSATFV